MKNFNKKQKIILIVICIILLGAILYYVYGKETPSINKNEILPYENITDDDMSEEKNVQNLFNILFVCGVIFTVLNFFCIESVILSCIITCLIIF